MLFRFYTHWRSSYIGLPRNIWLLALVSLINRCGGMVVVFLTLYMTQYLHFEIREAGYVMGFFGLGAMTGAYIGGRLTDRIGYFPVQFWSLVLNGVVLMLLPLVTSFWMLAATVFMLSLISETFRPANSVAILRNSLIESRTRSISLMRMSYNLGWTVAPALGGLLVGFGWHWLFWVDGTTCVSAALMLRVLMPPVEVSKSNAVVSDDPDRATDPADDRSPFRDRFYHLFLLFTMLGAVVFMQLLWTVPVFFKESYHWTEATIGIISALNGLIVFMVEMPLIHQIDGKRHPFSYVRIGLLLFIAAYLTFTTPLSPLTAALVYMVLISLGEIFVMPFSSNFMYGRASKKHQGQYTALYTMSYSVSNILAPLFGTQVIAAWGYQTLWYLLGGLGLVTWVGFRAISPGGKRADLKTA
jgi:predicted MFS family arabinose efflux permease